MKCLPILSSLLGVPPVAGIALPHDAADLSSPPLPALQRYQTAALLTNRSMQALGALGALGAFGPAPRALGPVLRPRAGRQGSFMVVASLSVAANWFLTTKQGSHDM